MTKRFSKKQLNQISIEYSAVRKFWELYSSQKNYVDNRQRCNVVIKHAFAVVVRKHTSLSLAEIGSVIDKDHASVLHAKKNHDSNIKYLVNYKRTYNEIEREIKDILYHEEDVATAEDLITVKELRIRLINISGRLREKVLEIKYIKEHHVNHPIRVEKENVFLKKHNREIHERNKRLEKELLRLKNLI